jgi:hypothetical protein
LVTTVFALSSTVPCGKRHRQPQESHWKHHVWKPHPAQSSPFFCHLHSEDCHCPETVSPECAAGARLLYGACGISIHDAISESGGCRKQDTPSEFCRDPEGRIMSLTSCIIKFFDQYLLQIKGCSPNTIKSYRDTFSLFLPFAARYHRIKTGALEFEHLTTDLILSFLNQLESDRSNTAKTRNQRLAVLKSFAKMIRFISPEQQRLTDAILAIPQKRNQRKLIGFLYPQEINKIFNAVKLEKRTGSGTIPFYIFYMIPEPGQQKSPHFNWITLIMKTKS